MQNAAFVSQRRAKQLFPGLAVNYWLACGLIPKDKEGHLCLAFLQRLARHTKGVRLTRQHVELFLLEWRSINEPEALEQVTQQAADLVASGAVYTLRETAQLVGYAKPTVHAWANSDFLVGARLPHLDPFIKRMWVYLRSDVMHVKKIMDSLTQYEAAERLGITPRATRSLAKANKIKGVLTPSGWRFLEEDVQAYIKASQPSSALPSNQAMAYLGVGEDAFYDWVANGHVRYTTNPYGNRLYDLGDLQKAKRLRETIQGGFGWYPATIDDATYPTKVVARKLHVSISNILLWAQDGLLPFFDLTPPGREGQKKPSIRMFASSYVDELAAFAEQSGYARPKRAARAFKEHMRQKFM